MYALRPFNSPPFYSVIIDYSVVTHCRPSVVLLSIYIRLLFFFYGLGIIKVTKWAVLHIYLSNNLYHMGHSLLRWFYYDPSVTHDFIVHNIVVRARSRVVGMFPVSRSEPFGLLQHIQDDILNSLNLYNIICWVLFWYQLLNCRGRGSKPSCPRDVSSGDVWWTALYRGVRGPHPVCSHTTLSYPPSRSFATPLYSLYWVTRIRSWGESRVGRGVTLSTDDIMIIHYVAIDDQSPHR